MEITKMLTVSTAHIMKNTPELLNDGIRGLVIYKKDEYGWFIFVPSYDKEYNNLSLIMPDLHRLLVFAKDMDCEWLCLDCDGEILEYFQTYKW